ncbi:hypothetical protein ACVIVD_003555 [Bradyrhizobium liaoningense]
MIVVTEDKITIAKVEVERFSLTSAKPFEAVVATLKSAIGRKRVFYRTGYARGWPRRRVTPGPSSVIGTAWLT